jgi:hypothetical protein
MSAARHTPGPWYLDERGEVKGLNGERVVLAGGFSMGSAYKRPEREANAALAVAAPDLLTHLTQLAFMARTSGNPTPELIRACEGAEALISKTTGSNHG